MKTTTDPIADHLHRCLPRLTADWREDDRLADLALDSIDTVELLCVIHEEFGVRILESDLHPGQTVGGLLAVVAEKSCLS